jgi:hypothetical protein
MLTMKVNSFIFTITKIFLYVLISLHVTNNNPYVEEIMKLVLMALLFQTMSASFSFAGTPDVDPDIALLRKTFEDAGSITKRIIKDDEYLRIVLSESWDCKWKSAYNNDYTTGSNKNRYQFQEGAFPSSIINIGTDNTTDFTITEDGIIGAVNNSGVVGQTTIRITNDLKLIAEFSVLPDSVRDHQAVLEPISKVNSNLYRVGVYLSCVSRVTGNHFEK